MFFVGWYFICRLVRWEGRKLKAQSSKVKGQRGKAGRSVTRGNCSGGPCDLPLRLGNRSQGQLTRHSRGGGNPFYIMKQPFVCIRENEEVYFFIYREIPINENHLPMLRLEEWDTGKF